MYKIYTSYFYNVRFMTPNQVPLSTARWDPKWFHNLNSLDPEDVFFDKNGVINGLKLYEFVPNDSCVNLCKGRKECTLDYTTCDFLKKYREQLSRIDLHHIEYRLNSIAHNLLQDNKNPINVTEFILLVYEAPDNPCSERVAIQEYFNSRGIECVERSFR